MSAVRIVGNDVIISVDEVVANMENAALIEDNKRLQAENDKLRELVLDMWDWLAPTAICGGAPLQGIVARMRKLGVEV